MPCTDGGPPGPSREDVLKQRLDTATDLLCGLCKKLEKSKIGKKLMTRELAKWWQAHQEADRIREESERMRRERETTRQRALAKLSPAERRILGIRE